jgi:hypothetical protein
MVRVTVCVMKLPVVAFVLELVVPALSVMYRRDELATPCRAWAETVKLLIAARQPVRSAR